MSSASTERFSRTPPAFWGDRRISTTAMRVMGILGGYADDKWTCWPAQETIANDLGMNRSTINRAIQELVHYGWLACKPGKRRKGQRFAGNAYLINQEGNFRFDAPSQRAKRCDIDKLERLNAASRCDAHGNTAKQSPCDQYGNTECDVHGNTVNVTTTATQTDQSFNSPLNNIARERGTAAISPLVARHDHVEAQGAWQVKGSTGDVVSLDAVRQGARVDQQASGPPPEPERTLTATETEQAISQARDVLAMRPNVGDVYASLFVDLIPDALRHRLAMAVVNDDLKPDLLREAEQAGRNRIATATRDLADVLKPHLTGGIAVAWVILMETDGSPCWAELVRAQAKDKKVTSAQALAFIEAAKQASHVSMTG